MKLDDSQKQKVAEWIGQGLSLSEIQNKLASDLGLRLTYMEVRFLIDDLRLKPVDKEPVKSSSVDLKAPSTANASPAADAEGESILDESDSPSKAGSVSVKVDQLARPGAVVSGNVTFGDGKSADWYLDQYGRLGMIPKQTGYKPSQGDLMEFQAQLQDELAKLGY
jgi:hypothetical protein